MQGAINSKITGEIRSLGCLEVSIEVDGVRCAKSIMNRVRNLGRCYVTAIGNRFSFKVKSI
uniref:Uncharacterized protein n=1 Tax=Octopus bimaculoides TaxID=37653 RepID=A0A0L8I702_OCTBM